MMDDSLVEQLIREYLPQVIHMSVATCADNKPWVFEVHYVFDDGLNLYWVSSQGARHSQEVANNANVSGNIVVQHFLNQPARGVAFEGRASMVESLDENQTGYQAYVGRFKDRAAALLPAYASQEGVRMYKIAVSDFYLVDGMRTGKPEKHHLPWNNEIN